VVVIASFGTKYLTFLIIIDVILFVALPIGGIEIDDDAGRLFKTFGNLSTDELGNPQISANTSQTNLVDANNTGSAVSTAISNFFTQGLGFIFELFKLIWSIVTVSYYFVVAMGIPYPANLIIAITLNAPGVFTIGQFIFGRLLP